MPQANILQSLLGVVNLNHFSIILTILVT